MVSILMLVGHSSRLARASGSS